MTGPNADLVVEGDKTTIHICGDLDMRTVKDLLALVTAATTRAQLRILIVDLNQVPFIDSTGIGGLVATRNLCRANSIELQLHAPAPRVRAVLELTHLADVFDLHPR